VLPQEVEQQLLLPKAFVVVASIAVERLEGIDLSAAYCLHLVYLQLALLLVGYQVNLASLGVQHWLLVVVVVLATVGVALE
jgi:hypothetical protein